MAKKDPKVLSDTYRALAKAFPRTDEGMGTLLHAQLYFQYAPLYVYLQRSRMNEHIPESAQRELTPPVGERYTVVEELVRTVTNRAAAQSMSMETNSYHAKVLRPSDAEQIVTLKEDLDLGTLPKSIVPYEICRDAIINAPGQIAVVNCVCRRVTGKQACQPLGVCLLIGEPWVSYAMAREEGGESNRRLISQEEALQILKECHERGNVHAAFFKDVAAGRLYAICNCCSCCCTALVAHNHLGATMMAGSGYVATIDQAKCAKCGICEKTCPFLAISKADDGSFLVNKEICLGCEGCLGVCRPKALTFELVDASVLAPLDIKALKEKAKG